MNDFTCHNLADRPDLLEAVAQAGQETWGKWESGWLLDDWMALYRTFMSGQGLEQMLVAVKADGDFAGMAALTAHELPDHPALLGWLYDVYIVPQYRQLGLGSWLSAQVEGLAVGEGLTELHLATTEAQGFYEGLGWRRLKDCIHNGVPVTIMHKKLNTFSLREETHGKA